MSRTTYAHCGSKFCSPTHDVTVISKERISCEPSFPQSGATLGAGNTCSLDNHVIMCDRENTLSEPAFNANKLIANQSCGSVVATDALELNDTSASCAFNGMDNNIRNTDSGETFGPEWSLEFKSSELVPALLSCASSITQALIKKYVRYVQGYMKFINESAMHLPQ